MRSLLIALVAYATVACCTAKKYTPPVRFKYFLIEAVDATRMDVVCDNEVVYSANLKKGQILEVGGPEGPCVFITTPPAQLLVEPVFEDATSDE